ncbi:putative ankyrin repeat protein RBE_0997 [Ptychodera flava]|uniref:putative ankyrin repeat protein RBE_0997 n=1 Tax=Ptychodera flava TaxID=63121 RepID=UPI00396AAA4D
MGDWAEKQRLREEIIEAVKFGDTARLDKLLDNGADINECEGGYLTKKNLLMMAIQRKDVDTAVLLINRGIDLSFTVTVDQDEKTASDMAKQLNLNVIVELIEKKNSANQDFVRAVKLGIIDLADRAIQDGANINIIENEGSEHGGTMLMIAICSEQQEMAQFLIRRGINLDFVNKWEDPSSGERYADTARDYAMRMHYNDIAELIDEERRKRKERQQVQPNGHIKSQAQVPQTKQANGDLMDVEDFEQEENTIAEVNKQQTVKKKSSGSGSCVIF